MTSEQPGWQDTSRERPPADHLYRSATWLLGRHPRLARLAARIQGVIELEDSKLRLDLDHLAQVVVAVPTYEQAWREYETRHREPHDEREWDRWQRAGPDPDSIVTGLSDFLVMSSGEVAILRLLATFANERTLFRVSDLASLDAEGQRLLTDWTDATRATYGITPRISATTARVVDVEPLDCTGRSL